MTLYELINNVMVQGHIKIVEMSDYGIEELYEKTTDYLGYCKEIEPYSEREVGYIYSTPFDEVIIELMEED